MTNTGSYSRGGQPRSVADPLDDSYEAMIARQRVNNATREAQEQASRSDGGAGSDPRRHRQVDHPGAWESMAPIWGSGKEALADLEDKKYVSAGVNAALAASDLFLGKALVSGLAKGGLKMSAPYLWRTKPWDEVKGARQWLGEKGFLKPGQPGHHWLIPQKSGIPDWIKNQPPFVMGTKDAVEHGRIHGPYTVDGVKLPQFNAFERIWKGSPPWAKAAYVSTAGHAGAAAGHAGQPPAGRR